MGAFIIVGIWFFVSTVFFGPEKKMIYKEYLPENSRIGHDFLLDYEFGHRYFVEHKSAYIGDDSENWYTQNAYPPLFTFYLYPLYRYQINYLTGYYILAGLIILSFISMCAILPYWYHKQLNLPSVSVFVLATGLLSYGMQFALERGQFDMLCMAICLTSIFIFWYYPKLRNIGVYPFHTRISI